MIASKILSLVAIALSASAAPLQEAGPTALPPQNKPFKLGVTTAGGKTIFLTKTEKWASQQSDGIDCRFEGTKIFCGGEAKLNLIYGMGAATGHTQEALLPVAQDKYGHNGPFSFDAKDSSIRWTSPGTKSTTSSGPAEVHFSTSSMGAQNKIYAEVCSDAGHPDGITFRPGVAKAYFN